MVDESPARAHLRPGAQPSATGDDRGVLIAGRWVLTAAILASTMDFVTQSALNVALPSVQASLGASGVELLWIVNSYGLLLAALILVGGSLGDRLGRRRVFAAGIALYAAASLACGLSPSSGFLIAARALQGLSGALMVPGSLALITAHFAPQRRGAAFGAWAAVTTIALVGGPLVGGLLAETGLWRLIFLLTLPLAAAALAVLRLRVGESRDETANGPIDWGGTALVTVGLAGLAYGFTSAPRSGFSDPWVAGSLACGAAALAGFIVLELRSSHPMVPPRLFRSPTFSGTNLLTFFLYGGLYGYTVFFSLNLIQGQGYRESLAGLASLPFIVVLAAISRWSGKLVDRVGPRLPLAAGPAIVAVSFALHAAIGLTSGPSQYWTTFFPVVTLAGLGMGITVAPLTAAVMGSVADRYAGTASGINNATSRIGGVLAIAILGAVALFAFEGSVQERAAALGLPQGALEDLRLQTARLGRAEVPPAVSPPMRDEVALLLRRSFVDTCRLMMLLCAALAAAGAVLSGLLVEQRPERRPDPEPRRDG